MKKVLSLVLVLMMVLVPFSMAASYDDSYFDQTALIAEAEKIVAETGAKIPIKFWYNLGGKNQEIIAEIAKRFNESQELFEVLPEFAGGYNDCLLKYLSTPAEERPDLLHMNAIGYQKILDDGYIIPIQEYADAGIVDLSQYFPCATEITKYDDVVHGIPLNLTTLGIIYNVDYFEAAGIDPSTIKTVADYAEASKKIVEMGICDYGGCLVPTCEQMSMYLHTMGVQLGEVGEDGYVTRLSVDDTGALTEMLETLKVINTDPAMYYSNGNASARSMFVSGALASFCATVGNYGVSKNEAAGAFEISILPMLYWDDTITEVPYALGGIMNIVDNGDPVKSLGCAMFSVFYNTPENQYYNCTISGYIPFNNGIYDLPEYMEFFEANPDFKNVLEFASQGRGGSQVFGSLDSTQSIIDANFSKMIEDPSYTGAQCAADSIAEINELIEMYNLSNY